jgi:Flp pilus assembly protein TadG
MDSQLHYPDQGFLYESGAILRCRDEVKLRVLRGCLLLGPVAKRVRVGRGEAGASLVEYGLSVVFIFLPLLFGIGGFGHALFAYHFVNHSAKEATRYAAVRGSTCSNDSSCVVSNSASGITGPTTQADVQTYVRNMATSGIKSSNITVTATWPGPGSPPICSGAVNGVPKWPNNNPGCTVEVQVQYAYNFILPLVHTAPITMSSTSEMVIVH